MKYAAAYIRVSTGEQTEYSPDSQLKAIKRFAQEHELILPEAFIFIDEGISGRKADKRPSFQQMICTARQKPRPFDVILLWKFSRFARNRQDSIIYKSMLRKQCGIDVVSVSEQLGSDNTSVLIEALIEAMDEYYSLNLAEEVRRGMNEKFSRGGIVSVPPFGYKAKDGVFVPDNGKAAAVQMIFSDFLAGMSMGKIAEKLNSMGILTAKGNRFENRAVKYILTNPTYTGKLRRSINGRDNSDRFHQSAENTMLTDGLHIPIISREVFEAVKTRLAEDNKLYAPYSRHSPASFMLKGLVRCGGCGGSMTMTSSHSSLQCSRYAKGSCTLSHSITLKKLNEAVIRKIQNDLGELRVCTVSESRSGSAADLSALLKSEKKKLSRIREAFEAGIDSAEEYRANKQRITAHIDEISSLMHKVNVPMKCSVQSFSVSTDILVNYNVDEALKNIILRSFIEKIIFYRNKDLIEIVYRL